MAKGFHPLLWWDNKFPIKPCPSDNLNFRQFFFPPFMHIHISTFRLSFRPYFQRQHFQSVLRILCAVKYLHLVSIYRFAPNIFHLTSTQNVFCYSFPLCLKQMFSFRSLLEIMLRLMTCHCKFAHQNSLEQPMKVLWVFMKKIENEGQGDDSGNGSGSTNNQL